MNQAKKVDKDWGYEIWMANNKEEDYCGKILHINSNSSTSMHFHVKKHETFYVTKGTLCLHIMNTQTTESSPRYIEKGQTFELSRAIPHKLEAFDNPVEIIEISTFHEDSDSYRVSK